MSNYIRLMCTRIHRALVFILSFALISISVGCCSYITEENENNDLSEITQTKLILTRNDYEDIELLTEVINLNCRYILREWWYEGKIASWSGSHFDDMNPLTIEQKKQVEISIDSFTNWRNTEYLDIPNWKRNEYSENAILPSCYACRVLSTALFYDIYDEDIIGVNKQDALNMNVKLISSLAKYHCSNSADGWGNCWQGALWAEMLGMSAYMMKDYIASDDWDNVCSMVMSEADFVANEYSINVYKDRLGIVVEGHEGDSKSEENAWNASVLALAQCFFPESEELDHWHEKFIELCVSSLTRPSDVFSDKIIDGYSFINAYGSNINEDGTVVNHGRYHIDYMASPIESFAESAIALAFAGKTFPDCITFNVDLVYGALINLDLGGYDKSKEGHHFYERISADEPSCATNMPGDNDWGRCRQANYFLVDTYADLMNMDRQLPASLKAKKWAHTRIVEIIRMVNRDDSGKIYKDGEEKFVSGQLYAMACLSQVFSLRMFEKYRYFN